MIRRLLTALALAPAGMAGAFELALPLDCTLGETCHVQNYFDRDSGPGWLDVGCGALSYDGHDGTDFALPTRAAMDAGVNVLAAAAGTVRGLRDGMPDIPRDDPAAPPLQGRDCGNGVAIDHGDGWETQYCHMQRGSIAVKPGERVTPGTVLGRVGLSGNTVFPHLHLSVRKDGVELDPFAPDPAARCGPPSGPELWSDDLTYDGFGFLAAGLADAVPEYDAIRGGLPPQPVLATDAPALVIWAYFFGARAGDVLTLTLTGPEGDVIRQDITLDRTQAQAFRATGRKARGPWPRGDYRGKAVLTRDGTEVERTAISATVD